MQRFYCIPLATVKHANRIFHGMTPHELRSLVWVREMTASGQAQQLRESARLSRAELASLVPVPRPTLQSWESGRRRPTGGAALRYAQCLAELNQLMSTPVAS